MTEAHTEREFAKFMSELVGTNATLSYFCDFNKAGRNVARVAMRLNQLNFLIGQPNMEKAVRLLWEENPKVFSILDILIAVRRSQKKKVIGNRGKMVPLECYFETVEGVLTFLAETGLQAMLQSKQVKDLVDYVFGVEVGLDSNSRKNRGGNAFADKIATIFEAHSVEFEREINSTAYPELNILGMDKKRFDFVVSSSRKKYLIEVNFYNTGGSKLNEVARSYSDLAPKINAVDGFEFVWITDGLGWTHARNKLGEAFRIIPCVYNLASVTTFID